VQAHVQQELHSTLQTLWEEPDQHLAAHMTALSILGCTRAAVEASGNWHDDLDILADVGKAVLSHGVAVLETSMASWDNVEEDWEMWRVEMSAASARHPVSAALASVHNGACNAMLQFSNLTKAAEALCKVTVDDVHARWELASAGCCDLTDCVSRGV
jgi:Lon protease-like protein